jgi:hypothetical protein
METSHGNGLTSIAIFVAGIRRLNGWFDLFADLDPFSLIAGQQKAKEMRNQDGGLCAQGLDSKRRPRSPGPADAHRY